MMNIVKFATIVAKLKGLKRTGWVKNHVPNPESVAEHSFRLAVLAMIIAPKIGADQLKCIKMALIHDIGEAEIGDIVTKKGPKVLSNLSKKIILERRALKKILCLVDTKEYLMVFESFFIRCSFQSFLYPSSLA